MIRKTLSHRIPHFPHHLPAALLFALSAFAAMPLHAGQQPLAIESFTVLKADADTVEVELVGSNDGSLGMIWVGANARSKDGTIRSNGFRPAFFPVGQHVRFSAQVARPEGPEKPQTDLLMVMAYQANGPVIVRNRFEWPYAWSAIPPKPSSGITDDYTDLSARNTSSVFFQNLDEEDFDALDLLVEKWNSPGERNNNGEWKLAGYTVALDYFPNDHEWKERLERVQKWKKLKPRSVGAAIAGARYWIDSAWHIRGGIWNEVVDPVAMRMFGERMKRAEKTLLDSKAHASGNPLWYEAYLDLAIATKRSDTFIEALFEEAIRKHPLFQPLYTTMATRWAPRQGGKADWGKVDALVDRAVSLTSDLDGQDNYARLYAQISELQRREVDILEESRVSWPRMKDSFNELVKHYPSAANLNEFAVFACRAGDKETFLNLSVKIQGHVVTEKWPDNYSPDLCTRRFMENT